MFNLLPLALLPSGQSAQIHSFVGCAEQIHRLEELGIRQGVSVEMLQSGNPCILRVGGAKLCFRPNDALGVMVNLPDWMGKTA